MAAMREISLVRPFNTIGVRDQLGTWATPWSIFNVPPKERQVGVF